MKGASARTLIIQDEGLELGHCEGKVARYMTSCYARAPALERQSEERTTSVSLIARAFH